MVCEEPDEVRNAKVNKMHDREIRCFAVAVFVKPRLQAFSGIIYSGFCFDNFINDRLLFLLEWIIELEIIRINCEYLIPISTFHEWFYKKTDSKAGAD